MAHTTVHGQAACTISWDGGGDGTSWHNQPNWNTNILPGPADTVCIDAPTALITVTHSTGTTTITALQSEENISVSGGTLSVSSTSVVNGIFRISGGIVTGTGSVTISEFVWAGGLLSGTGSTTVSAGGTLSIDGTGGKQLQGRMLVNQGSGTWKGGGFDMVNGAQLVNQGSFDIQTDALLSIGGSPLPRISNTGTFTKSTGTGSTTMRAALDNSGSVTVQTGTLNSEGGGTSSGSFAVASGATLGLSGSHTLSASSSVTGAGRVNFSGPATTVAGSYNVTGITAAPGGSTTLTGNVQSVGQLLTLSGGVLTFNSGEAINVPVITVSGGILGGSDAMTTPSLTWTGGILSGTGSTTVSAGGTLSIDGTGGKQLQGRMLVNQGSGTWKGGGFDMVNGAQLVNQGSFDIQTDALLSIGGSPLPRISNTGTFTKSAGTGSTTMRTPFENSGVVEIQKGMLTIDSTYRQTTTGTLKTVIAGLTAGTQFGRLTVSGLATLDGTLTPTLANGYAPNTGDSFAIVTYGSRTGAFTTITPLLNGPTLQATYNPTNLTLTVEAPLNKPPSVAAGGPFSVYEGSSVTVTAAAADPDVGDSLTYSWDLNNDGQFETAGQQVPFSASAIDGPSVHTISVKVIDSHGASATDETTVTIVNAVPTATFTAPAEVNEGSPMNLTLITPHDVPADLPTLQYAFDCGDGSGYGPIGNASSMACSTIGSGTRVVKGRVIDKDAGFTEYTTQVVITAVNKPPTVMAGGSYHVAEGSSLTLTAAGSDPEGGLLSYRWDLDNDGVYEMAGQTAIFSAVTIGGPESRAVKVQVADSGGLTASDEATITIDNVAPVIQSMNGPLDPVPVKTVIGVNATFTDAGVNDTHNAVIDWGNGQTTAGTITGGTINGTYSYTTAGVYTVTVRVSDNDGGVDTRVFQYVVVYDPSGGFVTGGGWIDSPEGAYHADSSLTGPAHFGFVAKYQKGATVPTGQTQFQFQVANLRFHSTAYEWLVVSGARAQYKGNGTINGSGDYGFLLTSVDGQVNGGGGSDRFRIKIWNKASGTVVYDNQPGASDDSVLTTVLRGGSIVIHTGK